MELLLLLSVIGVVVVNGWTDAPNAITSVVCSGAMTHRKAAAMAALCNGVGAMAAGLWFPAVATAMTRLTGFGEVSPRGATAALCWVMAVVALWGTAAWRWGIPTSESHALLAGLAGASVALGSGLPLAHWWPVLAGLVLSVGLGALAGWFFQRRWADRLAGLSPSLLRRIQVGAAAAMATAHGAQDGQKFAAMLLGAGLAAGNPLWSVALCAAAMALGTSVGGERIIRRVGVDMVTLDSAGGVCSDAGAALPLLLCTLLGLPVSTSHVKVCAVAGVGAARGGGALHTRPLVQICTAWALTFPLCFGVAWAGVTLLQRLGIAV